MQIYNKKFYLGIVYEIIRQLWAYLNKKQYFCSPKEERDSFWLTNAFFYDKQLCKQQKLYK